MERRWWLVTVVALLVAGLVVAACGSDATDPTTDPVARGQAVYTRNCSSCHGPRREGTTAGPPLRGSAITPDRIQRAVTKGVDDEPGWPAMPPLISIGASDRAALVAYLAK